MSEIQYGVRSINGNLTVWSTNKEPAQAQMIPGRTLMAREVGEPYEVKELPTTPGSVIRERIYGLLVLDESAEWGNSSYAPDDETILRHGWTLVFDAGQEKK